MSQNLSLPRAPSYPEAIKKHTPPGADRNKLQINVQTSGSMKWAQIIQGYKRVNVFSSKFPFALQHPSPIITPA